MAIDRLGHLFGHRGLKKRVNSLIQEVNRASISTDYLGQVATSTVIPASSTTGNKQMMTRSPHWARDNIYSLQLVYANWYMTGSPVAETVGQGPIDIQAAIEYPEGTITRVKFSGENQGLIPVGENLITDELPVVIPYGAKFWVRTWYNCAAGLIYNNYAAGFNEAVFGVTTPNLVMGGAVASSAQTYTPVAIIGMTSRPSVAIIGDSRVIGTGDTRDGSLNRGPYARAIGPALPYINMGVSGARLVTIVDGDLGKRLDLMNYCSHIICALGYNDLATGGASAATVHTQLQTLYGMFPAGKPVWQATIEPGMVTSTDSYVTAANQTINSGANTRRNDFNLGLRSGIEGIQGVLEMCIPLEDQSNPGKWYVEGSSALTADGTHANRRGVLRQVALSGLNPSYFQR